ncbi:YraN family protein [Thermodesulfobacteriota bacterium]
MTNQPYQFGKTSEAIAVKYLKKQKYKLLVQNYRTKFGEIDIIARDRKTLVFIEVKARKSDQFGHPKGAVTYQKQKRISRVTLHYLKETGQNDVKARFDVVSIRLKNGKPEIEVIKNAFEVTG